MAHPAVSANGQPNHALAAVPSANTALTIDSVLMMFHGIIGDMGFRPLRLAGTLSHFFLFGFDSRWRHFWKPGLNAGFPCFSNGSRMVCNSLQFTANHVISLQKVGKMWARNHQIIGSPLESSGESELRLSSGIQW